MNIYLEIREHITMSTELRRRVDAREAVTTDIKKIANERLTGIDGDFDAKHGQRLLKELLKRSYVHSIYGSTILRMSHKSDTSQRSNTLTNKHVDAAADLAAKEAEYEAVLKEMKQKEKIQYLEEQQRKQLEAEKRQLEHLQAEKDVKAGRARLQVYSQEAAHEVSSSNSPEGRHQASPASRRQSPSVSASSPEINVSTFAQAFQDSMALNRLSVPELSVFNGSPIQFLEWKASFKSLSDKRAISSADKLFYLRKYVGGPACKTLEGTF